MPYGPMLTGPCRDVCNLAIGTEVRGAEPSAPRPSYHSFGRPITYRHHHLAEDHHYHLAESSAPMPTPGAELLPLITTTIGPSRQHRGNINHHHHLAEPSAPMPTPWAEPLPLITITIGPTRQRQGQHHGPSHYYQSPRAPSVTKP